MTERRNGTAREQRVVPTLCRPWTVRPGKPVDAATVPLGDPCTARLTPSQAAVSYSSCCTAEQRADRRGPGAHLAAAEDARTCGAELPPRVPRARAFLWLGSRRVSLGRSIP